jgi:hypothetical protein
VNFVVEEGGYVRRLSLDFSSEVLNHIVIQMPFSKSTVSESRFSEGRSLFGRSETMEESIFIKFRTMFIKYITERYLSILQEFEHHHIYRTDTRVVEVEQGHLDEEYSEDEETIESTSEFKERLCITETFGFDIITSTTQGSVNDHLRSLWKVSQSARDCLASWTLEESFGASFGALQVQFPSHSGSHTAVVYVDLREGFLMNLGASKKLIG